MTNGQRLTQVRPGLDGLDVGAQGLGCMRMSQFYGVTDDGVTLFDPADTAATNALPGLLLAPPFQHPHENGNCMSINVAIAYFSGYGHTLELASAVRDGVESVPDTDCTMVNVAVPTETDWDALDAADAIIFGTPTYMGSASGAFHVFAEATSTRWMTQEWMDKLAAGFTNSGSMSGDKLHTLQYLSLLAAQHGMHWISLGLMPGWNTTAGSEHDHNRLGFYLGAGAQTWNDQGPEGVHAADLATARHLGTRVATQARIYRGAAVLA